MAAPAVAARSSGEQTTDSTSHPITLPTGITVGDLLLLIFTSDENPTSSTTSTGWIKLGGTNDGASNVIGAIFFKWATGSDACTITTTNVQQSTHIVLRIPNGGVPSAFSQGGNSTNSDPTAAFTFQTDDYLIVATRSGDAQVVPSAAPSGYTNLMNKTATGVNGASTSTAEKQATITYPAGSEDPGVWTVAAEQWVCWTILIPNVQVLNQTIIDDFTTGPVDTTTKWNSTQPAGTTVSISAAQLNLAVNASVAAYCHIDTKTGEQTPIGRLWGAKPVSVPATPASAETSINAGPVSGGWSFLNNGGNNSDQYDNGSGNVNQTDWSPLPTMATYIALGRWPVSGDMCWAYSPDGIHWRRHFSRAWPFGTQNIFYGLSHGHYDATQAVASTAVWDTWSRFDVPAGAIAFPKVRRGAAWVTPTAVKVRRSGAWVDVTGIKVRRGGAWVNET